VSATLYGRPADMPCESFPDTLKFALRMRYGPSTKHRFTISDIEYLRGLSDAGIKGAADLISLIEKHGSYDVWEEC
jgi:hypothetical protein